VCSSDLKAGKSAVQGNTPKPKKPGLLNKLGQAAGEFKQGYQQGQSDITAPATSAADINAQGPKGTAAATTQSGAAAQAIQKTAQATQGASAEKVGQTVYAQVKSQINQLDKKGKQRILQLLQKSLTAPPAAPAVSTQAAPQTTAQPAVKTKKKTEPKSVKPTQAEIDADRERLLGKVTDSKNYQNKNRV